MTHYRICFCLVLTLVAAIAGGCGQAPTKLALPPLHPVAGVVNYRGQPACGFRVIFHPTTDIGALKFAPYAITDASGKYKLRSYLPDDGAPQGDYAVTFQWPDHIITDNDSDPVPEIDKLRGVYSNPTKSQYKASVQPGPNQVPPFELR